jgi:hypothetical protein
MNRRRYLQGIVVTLIVGMFPLVAHARSGNNSTYDGVVNFGPQLLYLDDGCLSVDGAVTSGNFFEDLKRNDSGSLPEYRKRGELVTEYPESLTASIRIMGNQCAAAPSSHPPVFNGDSYSLTFEADWKNGFQLSPAALSPIGAHCVGSSVLINPSGDIITAPSVTCQLTIASKGVPLTDHLIVSVFAADGKRLTRLSAAP